MKHAVYAVLAGLSLLFCGCSAQDEATESSAGMPKDLTDQELSFLSDLRGIDSYLTGKTNEDTYELISEGWQICGYLSQGVPPTSLTGWIYTHNDTGLDQEKSKAVVLAAHQDLCPELKVAA